MLVSVQSTSLPTSKKGLFHIDEESVGKGIFLSYTVHMVPDIPCIRDYWILPL